MPGLRKEDVSAGSIITHTNKMPVKVGATRSVMNASEFPIVISPNLGCPHLLPFDDINGAGKISVCLIVAGRYGSFATPDEGRFKDSLKLRPSYPRGKLKADINLANEGPLEEIRDWDRLSEFEDADGTRRLINRVLHYEVLGPKTRYWRLTVSIDTNQSACQQLRTEMSTKKTPILYDLVFAKRPEAVQIVNYHAIEFVRTFSEGCRFVHLTDLHIARRNDAIIDEITAVNNSETNDDLKKKYVNFNENFRRFIRKANRMANRGELDFVVITGDIVDFAFQGWEDAANESENNWKIFKDIAIGGGTEQVARSNTGIKVAIFTSTGNHDWRTRPYDPSLLSMGDAYGLTKEELKSYNFQLFDTLRLLKRHEKSERDIRHNLEHVNFLAFFPGLYFCRGFKAFLKRLFSRKQLHILLSFIKAWVLRKPLWIVMTLSGLIVLVGLLGVGYHFDELRNGITNYLKAQSYASGIPLLVVTVAFIVSRIHRTGSHLFFKKAADFAMEFPLAADSMALHYYLKHINPYLNYAFKWGRHSFLVMDTGSDVFVGSFLDNKGLKDIKRISIEDNILGMSPNSRAFDSDYTYENWSQIVWLEKVLEAVNPNDEDKERRTFIFLHAPPTNVQDCITDVSEEFWEDSRKADGKKPWIPEEECDLTFGTINHYLSQFCYLCLGVRESDLVRKDKRFLAPKIQRLRQFLSNKRNYVQKKTDPPFGKVDIVFSGHAHRNIEFRIDTNEIDEIRMYCGPYNEKLYAAGPSWWEDRGPIFVQTAACGLKGADEEYPPYYRWVNVSEPGGVIRSFEIRNQRGRIFLCMNCIHLRDHAKCAAFPDGIPEEILKQGLDHTKSHSGDRGIKYEPKT